MKLEIIIPYRLYIFSLVSFSDLNDLNKYEFTNSDCSGFFTINNVNKCHKRIFTDLRTASNIYTTLLHKYHFDTSKYDCFLVFNVTCTSTNLESIVSDELSTQEIKRIRKEVVLSAVLEEIYKYLFLLVLRTNNSISILKGYAFYPKHLIAETKPILLRVSLDKYKDKFSQEMEMKSAWEYINRKTLFSNGLSKTNIARAMSLLTIIFFEDNSDISNMALTLTVLEALYARGNSGISSQLADKMKILLGTELVNAKEINQLYNIRSRYIHGDINVYMSFYSHDDDLEKDLELYDAYNYGIAIAFETIKKLINANKEDLSFDYYIN
jgi:hypothetical protein